MDYNENYEKEGPEVMIDDVDVIRALNGRFYVKDENKKQQWIVKSTVDCLTYGNCEICFKLGPMMRECCSCGVGWSYKRVKYNSGIPHDYIEIYLDAEALSALLQAGHEVARADRCVDWTKPKELLISGWNLDKIVTAKYEKMIRGDKKAFKNMFEVRQHIF